MRINISVSSAIYEPRKGVAGAVVGGFNVKDDRRVDLEIESDPKQAESINMSVERAMKAAAKAHRMAFPAIIRDDGVTYVFNGEKVDLD